MWTASRYSGQSQTESKSGRKNDFLQNIRREMGTVVPQRKEFDDSDIEQSRLLARFHSPFVGFNGSKSGLENWRCAWAPDNSYIAWSCGVGLVKVVPWNKDKNCPLTLNDKAEDGRPLKHDRIIRTFDAGELVYSVAFGCKEGGRCPASPPVLSSSPSYPTWYRYKVVNDLILAVGLKGGRIRTWNVRTGNVFLVLMDHTNLVQDLKFSPDGSLRLLSASRDGTLKLWHLDDDGNMSDTFRGKSSQNLIACCWSPDSRKVAGVGDFRGVYVWDMETMEQQQLRGHVNNVCGCSFSPDGALLATGSYDTTVIIWDTSSYEKLCKLHHLYPPPKEWMVGGANNHYVRYLSFSCHGRHISTVCEDGSLRVWDLQNTSQPCEMAELSDPLCCVFSPNGSAIAVGTREGKLSVWGSPRDSLNLQHLCRLTVQRALVSKQLEGAEKEAVLSAVPVALQSFLKYNNLTR